MGMSVKGQTQHRLVRDGMKALLVFDSPRGSGLVDHEREACQILIRRADLALSRIKKRKQRRAVHVAHLAAMPPEVSE